jgi:hypothetical protein
MSNSNSNKEKANKKKEEKKEEIKEEVFTEEEVIKEGENKGRDLSSLNKQGGVTYFHTSVTRCNADLNLLQSSLTGFNKHSLTLSKAIFSPSSDNLKLLCLIYVPDERKELLITDWVTCIVENLKNFSSLTQDEITVEVINATQVNLTINCSLNKEIGALQVFEKILNHCYNFLVSRKIIIEEEDDDVNYEF